MPKSISLRRLLPGKQRLEICERGMGRPAAAGGRGAYAASRFQLPLVFIVVTVQTQQLPIAAIGRVIVVIVILVVDGKLPQSLALEFPSTARANRWEYFERLLAIPPHPNLSFASSIRNELIPPVASWSRIIR
jgi:hypothetical protein